MQPDPKTLVVRALKHFALIGDMCWPQANVALGDVEYAIRYGTPTRTELLIAAGVMAAYRQMVHDPREKRERVIRALRMAAEMEPEPTAEPPYRNCDKGGLCMWKIDGQHGNEYCGKCFGSKPGPVE